jgi:N-acyl-D-aspartate/D-glutamate deacylase
MATFDTLVRGGLLIDGTGAPGRPADVGVRGDRIAAVGALATVEGTRLCLINISEPTRPRLISYSGVGL